MKKAALYIRVSTLEQAQEGYSIGAQKERLLAYCKAHDWSAAHCYIDGGYSGSNLDRPAIQELIADIKSFDVVLVMKLDRLSRSQRDTLYLIESVFLPAGVDFVSMSEAFDTSAPFGRAMIGILSVFAQLERETIRERTVMGRMERAKEGLFHGGAFPPIGYDIGEDGHLVINEYEAVQVRKIFGLYVEGKSLSEIAQLLHADGFSCRYGSWDSNAGPARVNRILKSDLYLGTIHFKSVITENAHPALVDRETFEKVAEIMGKKAKTFGNGRIHRKYLLSGLLICGRCGARYHPKGCKKDKYVYYYCYSRSKNAAHMVKDPNCRNKIWRDFELESIVEKEVSKLLFAPDYYEELLRKKMDASPPIEPTSQEIAIRKRIDELGRQIDHMMDLYQDERIPMEVVSDRIEKLHHEKTVLEGQLASFAPPPSHPEYGADAFAGLLADFSTVWDSADLDERHSILSALIRRIVLDGDQVKIEWEFLQ